MATIVPISAEDLELHPRLTDSQAKRLWMRIALTDLLSLLGEREG